MKIKNNTVKEWLISSDFLIKMIEEYGEETDLTDIIELDKQGIEKIVNKIKSDYRIDILLEVLREKGVI